MLLQQLEKRWALARLGQREGCLSLAILDGHTGTARQQHLRPANRAEQRRMMQRRVSFVIGRGQARARIERYGVSIRDVQDVIEIAIGSMNIMEPVEGRERYPIRVRYLREFREDIPELEKILLPTSTGAQVPLAQVLTIKSVLGPQEIKGERGLLVGYVTMNTRDRDEVSVVEDAESVLQAALKDGRLKLPAGYFWEWSGQFENQVRATKRMQILVPVCIALMFVSLFLGFRRKWIAPVIFMDVAVSLSAGASISR